VAPAWKIGAAVLNNGADIATGLSGEAVFGVPRRQAAIRQNVVIEQTAAISDQIADGRP
jgi:hypothetical protein